MKERNDEWFAGRMKESRTGAIRVPTYLIRLYRREKGDTESSDASVKCKLIQIYNKVLDT